MTKTLRCALAMMLLGQIAPLHAAPAEKIVLAITVDIDATPLGRLMALAYREAFRQVDLELEMRNMPGLRASAEAEAGKVDGEAGRSREYGELHPTLVRVEEPFFKAATSAFTISPDLKLNGWDSLKGKNLRVEYRAGYPLLRMRLEPIVAKPLLSVINDGHKGLKKLALGRSDVYVDLDDAILPLLQTEEFKHDGIRIAGPMESTPIHIYLNARHADLAPRLSAVFKAMKSSGIIDQLRERAARSELAEP